ncbi:MAG: flagellar hook-length control protein FliK, partial [Bdellovibrionales bacterium]|nr:flagellar hook-length control protein FliK [Bdellovibrionales bacterium]
QQSQLLATKGGGEAKIKLNPDGLGEITMKVKVADGRVHVDLLAENNHTKKLIEKGLGDLKANLAAHKLDVDMIKVDLSNNVADQFKDQQRDAERHFAQQFLQDFRQNNQGFRQNFSYPGESLFKSQLEDRAINYSEGNPVPTKAKKSSRRLDLVA